MLSQTIKEGRPDFGLCGRCGTLFSTASLEDLREQGVNQGVGLVLSIDTTSVLALEDGMETIQQRGTGDLLSEFQDLW